MISRLEVNKPKTQKYMSQVNLDALIKREYMFADPNLRYGEKRSEDFTITALETTGHIFNSLRKPDFQRETKDWTPEKITEFIESVVSGDLIPAIIMWWSGTQCFVIDGAHRISALLAWVHNDYGDEYISRPFFKFNLDSDIEKLAIKTRSMVNKRVKPYQTYKSALTDPNADPKTKDIAIKLFTEPLKVQWVPGDANKAENSFFKINEASTPIDGTEIVLLRSRNKPNAIAARAIIHAGAGHKFWGKFNEENQLKIEELAKRIKNTITSDYNKPITSLDLPIAGKGYTSQSLELIYNLVNLSNDIPVEDNSKSNKTTKKTDENTIEDDLTGETTIACLENTIKKIGYIIGKDSHCLGLHPAIYFYSDTGRHQFTSLMAWIELIKDMQLHKSVKKFLQVRRSFEDFLIKHKNIVNQSITITGSGAKGYKKLFRLFKFIIGELQNGKSDEEIFEMFKENEFYKIKINEIELSPVKQKAFSSDIKSMIFFKSSFPNPQVCNLCKGYYYAPSAQADHIKRISEGGIGHVDNGQLTHPCCNSIKG